MPATLRVPIGDELASGNYELRPQRSFMRSGGAAMQTLFEDTLGTLTLEDWMRHMGATVGSVLPEDTRVTFQVEGDGGGTWTLVRTFKGWELHQGAATWPDATLSCTLPRFMDLVSGRIDARRAFLDGSVEVEGDVGLLLRLHQALPAA